MSRDSGPARPLEQKCIEPGVWYIEGRMVRRAKMKRGIRRWRADGHRGDFSSLADARDWIREQVQP